MSEQQQLVTFDVVAADSGAEFFLIDGNFRLVKKGIGHETFAVPQGIYKIKSRSGRTTAERLIVVRQGMSTIRLDPVRVSSAIPLLHTAQSHEHHMSAASGAASGPNLSRGTGSNIVIVARQWTGPAPRASQVAPPNPARGLTLLDSAGGVVADVAALTTVAGTLDPIVTLNVEVTPGPYRLSLVRADGRRIEQTLIASPGWQTHAYFLVDGTVEDETARVDLVNSAITMRRPDQGFAGDDANMRAEEIARGALRISRTILSDEIRAQLTSTAASPMLALIGAHFLIREARDERERLERDPGGKPTVVDGNVPALRTIVGNLRAAVGRHPDVEAIAVAAGNPDPDFVFDVPPMLRASWPLLLDLSVKRAEAVPAESVTAHAAERIWGEGTWLQWLEAGPQDVVDRAALWQGKAAELIGSIGAVGGPAGGAVGGAVGGGVGGATLFDAGMSDIARMAVTAPMPTATPHRTTEEFVVQTAATLRHSAQVLFRRRSHTPFPAVFITQPGRPEPPRPTAADIRQASALLTTEQRAQLVRQLGVPLGMINAWLERVGK